MTNNKLVLEKLEKRRAELSTNIIICTNEQMVKRLEDDLYHTRRLIISIQAIEEEKSS